MPEVTLETCPHHNAVQHRDGKPPWCSTCGWTDYQPEVFPVQVKVRHIPSSVIPFKKEDRR